MPIRTYLTLNIYQNIPKILGVNKMDMKINEHGAAKLIFN
jgi:hypothetical protein